MSARSGCSFARWTTISRIIDGAVPEVRSGVIEVDDEPDPAAVDPDADAAAPVGRVHQVRVVTVATAWLLGLEVQVRAEHGRVGVGCAPAAEILGRPAAVAGP